MVQQNPATQKISFTMTQWLYKDNVTNGMLIGHKLCQIQVQLVDWHVENQYYW